MVGKTLAPDSSISRLRIYLAGGIAIERADGPAIGEQAFAGRQGRRLFVHLAGIHAPVAQVDLADDLWGPEWPATWEVSLRALVSKLRAALRRVGIEGAISSSDGSYELRLPGDAWLDLDAASEAIHRAETLLASGAPGEACGDALVARAIASRPLLPGEEAPWLEGLRRRLADVRLRALECLAEIWIARGDPALAARDAAEALGLDPFREATHRLLIRAHLAGGDHAAAALALEACRRLFRDELGVSPSPDTVALIPAAGQAERDP